MVSKLSDDDVKSELLGVVDVGVAVWSAVVLLINVDVASLTLLNAAEESDVSFVVIIGDAVVDIVNGNVGVMTDNVGESPYDLELGSTMSVTLKFSEYTDDPS